jgi:PIN domain nuclease of toxin-antitoxin system
VGDEPLIVLDTHVLVWWVSGSGRLSGRAIRAIHHGLRQTPLIASAITVLEIVTAVRRGRLELGLPVGQWIADLQALPELRFEPVSVEIARIAGSFEDALPGDPADRIIVATARVLGARLVTADARLRKSPQVVTVW